jgi:hypothetical protein
MFEPTARTLSPLADTQYEIDTRETPRFNCSGRPLVKVMIRPSFAAHDVAVRDISMKGMGLVCAGPIPPGSCLAVLWDFGHPSSWRTLRARVARATPCPRGGWIVGCSFTDRLSPLEIEAFFGANPSAVRSARGS